MITKIDIYDPVAEICERLGLDPTHVRRLTIDAQRREVEALIYATDEEGAKHIGPSGRIQTEVEIFPVST